MFPSRARDFLQVGMCRLTSAAGVPIKFAHNRDEIRVESLRLQFVFKSEDASTEGLAPVGEATLGEPAVHQFVDLSCCGNVLRHDVNLKSRH